MCQRLAAAAVPRWCAFNTPWIPAPGGTRVGARAGNLRWHSACWSNPSSPAGPLIHFLLGIKLGVGGLAPPKLPTPGILEGDMSAEGMGAGRSVWCESWKPSRGSTRPKSRQGVRLGHLKGEDRGARALPTRHGQAAPVAREVGRRRALRTEQPPRALEAAAQPKRQDHLILTGHC